MPRALLAWEFGGDLGHARRALAVARELRAAGHDPTLAFADLSALDPADASGFACVQAPKLPIPEQVDPSPPNASGILLNLGFGDPHGLAGALAAWAGLFHLFRPDVLVCDYAPSALLAARAAGIPRVTVGSGFSTPPRGRPMPSLRAWARVDPAQLEARDVRLVASVREAFAAAGTQGSAPASAADVFAADAHLICAWPEVDPFGPRTEVEYLGPQSDTAATHAVSWKAEARPRIVAYLKPRDPRFELVRRAIGRKAGEAIIAAPDVSPSQAAALSTERVRVIAGPVALDVLEGADLCMSHGGPGIVWAAMRHGVPQALLPLHLEQYLVSRRSVGTGFATHLEPDDQQPDVDAWLERALADANLRRSAVEAAGLVQARAPRSAGERIVQVLEG